MSIAPGMNAARMCSAPYARFGQHLGRNKNANALRRNLPARGVELAHVDRYDCHFFGPIHPEASDWTAPLRDQVAALEEKLADSLLAAGYDVLNMVRCKRPLDPQLWDEFRTAFPELSS